MLQCPKCGHDGPFDVLAELSIKLHSDGKNYDEYNDGLNWDNYTPCYCPKCDYEGTVGDFENG